MPGKRARRRSNGGTAGRTMCVRMFRRVDGSAGVREAVSNLVLALSDERGSGCYGRPSRRLAGERSSLRPASAIRALTDPMRPAVGVGALLHRLAIGFSADAAYAHGQDPTAADVPMQPMVGRLQRREACDHVALVPVSQPASVIVGLLFRGLGRSLRHERQPLAGTASRGVGGRLGGGDSSSSTPAAPAGGRRRNAVRRRAERAQLRPLRTRLLFEGLDLRSVRGRGPRSQGADAIGEASDLPQEPGFSIVQR